MSTSVWRQWEQVTIYGMVVVSICWFYTLWVSQMPHTNTCTHTLTCIIERALSWIASISIISVILRCVIDDCTYEVKKMLNSSIHLSVQQHLHVRSFVVVVCAQMRSIDESRTNLTGWPWATMASLSRQMTNDKCKSTFDCMRAISLYSFVVLFFFFFFFFVF